MKESRNPYFNSSGCPDPTAYHGLKPIIKEENELDRTVHSLVNDLYNCCRWCKWYQSGKCINDAFKLDEVAVHQFYEDGILSEAIKEGFNDKKFTELETALSSSKLSKKKQDEILKIFYAELDDVKVNWTEEIDEQVSRALQNFNFETDGGVDILDPHTFYCKNFW